MSLLDGHITVGAMDGWTAAVRKPDSVLLMRGDAQGEPVAGGQQGRMGARPTGK